MAVKIRLSGALTRHTATHEELELDARTVGELLEKLVSRYSGLRDPLLTERGQIRNRVKVYVNRHDITHLKQERTALQDGDVVSIVAFDPERSGTFRPSRAQALSDREIQRYSRHLIMPEVGMSGQLKLKASSVLLVGTGGLGAPVGLYLAAAGVGRIGLVDFDTVDLANLQRQVAFGTSDIARPKLEATKTRLENLNPEIRIVCHETRLTRENALSILSDYDIIVDCTDNFPTRYLINDACVLLRKPDIYGSVFRFEGQATVFALNDGPCYRCLYPHPPPPGAVPNCADSGVFGVLPGIVGAIQANETVKLITGAGESLKGRLLLFDALKMRFRELKLARNPDCPVCGEHPTVRALIDYDEFCGIRGEAPESGVEVPEIEPAELKRRMDEGARIFLLDVRELHESDICSLGGLPMRPEEIQERLSELNPADHIVAYCRIGIRSAEAVRVLKRAGFQNVWNLKGGLNAWADQVDPDMPKY